MPQSKIHWFDMQESPSLRMAGAAPQLATALRAMLGAYCGEDGDTPEACQAAEAMAREALAAIEPEGGDA